MIENFIFSYPVFHFINLLINLQNQYQSHLFLKMFYCFCLLPVFPQAHQTLHRRIHSHNRHHIRLQNHRQTHIRPTHRPDNLLPHSHRRTRRHIHLHTRRHIHLHIHPNTQHTLLTHPIHHQSHHRNHLCFSFFSGLCTQLFSSSSNGMSYSSYRSSNS